MSKNDDIPDFIPGIHEMPFSLAELQAGLESISKQVKYDIKPENLQATEELTEPIMKMIQDRVGGNWPPVAMLLATTLLSTCLEKFAIEVKIDVEEDEDDAPEYPDIPF